MDAYDFALQMTGQCLCFRSRRVSRLITRAYDDALRPLGLQATQLTLLNAVAMGGRAGAPMLRIAAALAMDLSTLSRNLRPLEREGAIEIVRDESDKRVRVARLTADGERLLAAAWPLWQQAHQSVIAALGLEGAETLRDQLDRTAASAGKMMART